MPALPWSTLPFSPASPLAPTRHHSRPPLTHRCGCLRPQLRAVSRQIARATRAPPRPRSTPDLWKYSTGSCLSTFFFSRMGRSPRSTSALWRYGMGSLRKYVFENGEEPQLHTGSVEVGYCVRTFTFLGQFARATRAPPRPRSTPDL